MVATMDIFSYDGRSIDHCNESKDLWLCSGVVGMLGTEGIVIDCAGSGSDHGKSLLLCQLV